MPSVWGYKNAPSCACREKGQEPLQMHWLEGAKGPVGMGVENFLQPLLGCTHPLVVEGNGCADSPLASLLRESAVKIFKTV